MAITGANFAVAESGSLVVVESEGNARMCLTMPKTLVSVVGIEKLVPTWRDMEIYLQMLARSATGERMNPYTSVFTGVAEGDGPQEMHIILLDNNRTSVLADQTGKQALRCIRCAACMNVCPVYERVGGHSYGSVYPGPIGAILSPQLRGLHDAVDRELPYASSLCAACFEACPMQINIPEVLVKLRADVIDAEHAKKRLPSREDIALGAASVVLGKAGRLSLAEKAASAVGKVIPGQRGFTAMPFFGGWFSARDMDAPPPESFRAWWKRTDGGRAENTAKEKAQTVAQQTGQAHARMRDAYESQGEGKTGEHQ
jgi:L-lactate dehydrogenase complex protein LldF